MKILSRGLIACLLAALPASSFAQTFPSRIVRIVEPSPPGSTTDLLARIMAEQLNRKWGVPVVVENVSGASGNVGAAKVSRADPDGYTLMVSPPGPISLSRLLYKNLSYDPGRWVPISLLGSFPMALVARKGLEVSNVRDVIALAKQSPGKLLFASPGRGTSSDLSLAQLSFSAGAKFYVIPYRGLSNSLIGLLGGTVDLLFDTIPTSLPGHRDGLLKILGLGSTTRSDLVPDIPTIAESGLPGFRSDSWFAMVAPPATPASIAEKINRDVVDIIRSPDTSARLRTLFIRPVGSTRDEAAQTFREETDLWRDVIKDLNLNLD